MSDPRAAAACARPEDDQQTVACEQIKCVAALSRLWYNEHKDLEQALTFAWHG
jgi:hypothetical protein